MKKLDTNQKNCIKIMTNMYENMYENKLDRNYSIYITDSRKKDETFDFQKFKIIRLFG